MQPDERDSLQPEENILQGNTGKRRGRTGKFLIVFAGLLLAGTGVAVYLKPGLFREGTRRIGLAGTQPADAREVYYCPMHTHYKSEKPGNCPICSMKLVKLEKPSAAAAPAAGSAQGPQGVPATPGMPGMQMGTESQPTPAAPAAPAGNTIFIPPQRQQLIGVQSVAAVVKPLVKEIRTVGKVAYDETKVAHIHTKVTGYIEDVFVDFVGKMVTKGDPLFTIYSPDLVATQEEYLLALKSRTVLRDSSFPWIASGSENLLEATRRRLRLWDVADKEIQTLEREGQVKRALTIYSPVKGVVTERAAYHHGRYVNPEMDLYTIVDLSTVWLLAEIYESELPLVKEGQTAEVEFPYTSGAKSLRGRVAYVYPSVNPKTRTTQVRMEFPNPGLTLRPDMFFNVKLVIPLGQHLTVPQDAVLDTGAEQYVFVDRGEGYFEPRAVKLGAEAGGDYAIQRGLKAGERVVTAANFILDSESRLKGVFANMGKPSRPEAIQSAATGGKVSVEIREPKVAKTGGNTLRLAVKDGSGKPVEDAEVEVTLFMPQMGSMPALSSRARLKHVGNGEYAGTVDIPMAWTWQTTVTVRKSGEVVGTVQTSITAR